MYEYPFLTRLLGRSYQAADNTEKHPLLLHVTQGACNYYSNSFSVTRQTGYPHYLVHFLFDGCGFFHIGNQDYLLKKGDAFLIPPGQAHAYRNSSSEPLGLLWMELSGDACRDLFSPMILNHIYTLTETDSHEAFLSMARLMEALTADCLPKPHRVSALAYSVLMELMLLADTNPVPQKEPYISEALNFIHAHFTEALKIGDLARQLHISPTYLTRLFRQKVGMTPLRYVHMKRVEHACLLLRTTHLTVDEISAAIGMYDSPSFCRLFKSIYSVTPAEYRTQA